MKVLWVVPLILAGCVTTVPNDDGAEACPMDGDHVLYMAKGHRLQGAMPNASAEFSNGFNEAFLADDMDEWWSGPAEVPFVVDGNITLEFWVRNTGTPAPVVLGGDPGEGYHWFNQIGTGRGFVMDYGREYAEVLPQQGSIHHYVETIAMPTGGLFVEEGDRLRALLTSLVVDDDDSQGQYILLGGDTPSQIRFASACVEPREFLATRSMLEPFTVDAHQGLITGLIPDQEGLNYADIEFDVDPTTDRLTIKMEQGDDDNPLKDDMDIVVLDPAGDAVASIGSPYADEIGTFYRPFLDAHMPSGAYTARVNSYSGHAYRGTIEITQEIMV